MPACSDPVLLGRVITYRLWNLPSVTGVTLTVAFPEGFFFPSVIEAIVPFRATGHPAYQDGFQVNIHVTESFAPHK